MEKEKILGFDVCNCNEQELIQDIMEDYNQNNQIMITNINPEIIINNYKDEAYIHNLNDQKYQIPDGIGTVLASKINKGKIKNRIAGIDFMYKIIEVTIKYNSKIFLYGAKPGIAEAAKKELENDFNNINIVGTCNGYVDEEVAIQMINNSNPDIVFVGLGSPKQENFIISNMDKLSSVKIFMPVGGSFDVVSKTLKRAPNWIIKMNLEWLYRLLRQPKRIFRQLKLITFMKCVILEKIKEKGESKKCQKSK
nr:WecB/TagA/CpsF family glycosyltransferase [Clostridia bacterium]